MPFVERNKEFERKRINELLKDRNVKKSHDRFEKEFNFRLSLINARKKSNLSQKELAIKTGLSQQAISRIETGYSSTTMGNMFKYLNALGITVKLVRDGK